MRRVAMIVMALAVAGVATASVSIVEGGQAQAVIVTADEPTALAQYAAEELVYHIERATGVALEIVTESVIPTGAKSVVFVGPCEAARAIGIDETALDNEQTVLRTDGNKLFIVGDDGDGPATSGDTRGGTLWGVYEIVERALGVVWMWPGELGTYVPATETVTIADLNETIEPHLWQRNIRPGMIVRKQITQPFTPEGRNAYATAQSVFLRRHRCGRRHPYRYGHSFEDWWQKYGEEHPEWFQLLENGKRGPATPGARFSMCVSNSDFHEEIVRLWQQKCADEPDVWHNIRVCENDIRGQCTCEKCMSWDGPQPESIQPRFGPRVVSDRYARFWKSVYDLASAIDPNVVVMSYAYVNYAPPPVLPIKLNPNILVGTVPDLFFPRTSADQQWVKDQWSGWRETGCSLFLRPNYMLHGYVMPHVFAHQFADEYQFEWNRGMVATDFDSLNGQWATQGTNLYALARMQNNGGEDIEKLLGEYYSGFGPAADHVKRYFDYWEAYTTKMLDTRADTGSSGIVNWSRYAKEAHTLFPKESFGPALEILNDAKQATGDTGEFADRVEFLRLGLEHAMMCARVAELVAGDDPIKSPFAVGRAIEKLAEFRREHEGSFISNLHFASFIEGRSWEIPEGYDGHPVQAISDDVAPLQGEPFLSLRGGYMLVAALGEGENYRAHIATRRVGANDSAIRWSLISPEDEVIARGDIPVTETLDLDVPVPAPGTYILFVQTNKNNARVTMLNDHAALAGESIGFVYQTSPVFFYVPEGMEEFTVSISGSWPGETVRARVYDPDGNEAATQATDRKGPIPITVAVGEGQDGKAWSLSFEETDEGVLEDYRVYLGEGLPQFWAHAADRLIVPDE